MSEFVPHRWLRNRHAMTIAAAFVRRRFPRLGLGTPREFEIEPGTRVMARCHWQERPQNHPTLILLHGLEGSCDANYVRGTGEKAWLAGFNVLRLNQRNCGGTEKLTPTLYHSGLSCDIQTVIRELIERDRLPEIFAAGFSMGGNLVLKLAGEFGEAPPPQLRAIAAICPALDLAACADALAEPANFVYERHFVTRLKRHMRFKASLFKERYPIDGMRGIRSVREFDDVITARFCGFTGATDYYSRSSASRVIAAIRTPTLIITAQDDPFVPFTSFSKAAVETNPNIKFEAPAHGGHCAFISSEKGEGRFWVEGRIVNFFNEKSKIPFRAELPQAIGVSSES
jgi:uncharacterized protein